MQEKLQNKYQTLPGKTAPDSGQHSYLSRPTRPFLQVNPPPAQGNVIQMTKWRWDNGTGKWHPLTEAVSEPPQIPGLYHGHEYDDLIQPPSRFEFGGGNFSFARSHMEKHPDWASSFTTSELDVSAESHKKRLKDDRLDIERNTRALTKKGATVSYGQNATTSTQQADVIHFLQPHTGKLNTKGGTTSTLTKSFFENAEQTQEEGNIIRMVMNKDKEGSLSRRYGSKKMLGKTSYRPIKKMKFNKERFPGYSHVKTTGQGTFDFPEDSQREVWFRKERAKLRQKDQQIDQLHTDEEYDSDEERQEVERRRKRDPEEMQRRRTRMQEKLRPEISMDPLTLTDNPHTGAYKTFQGKHTIRPTGRRMRGHHEVEILSGHRDIEGRKLFVRPRHLKKVGQF